MQRFKQLTLDARLSVLVTQQKTQEQKLNIGRRVLLTLQEAVHASRSVSMLPTHLPLVINTRLALKLNVHQNAMPCQNEVPLCI